MTMTARALNRATLARQLLLERARLDVVDAVGRLVALQAQHPASPYVALWNRLDGFHPADLDAAFAERALVKATLMRITLHAVPAGDYPSWQRAMQPTLRAARLNDPRFRVSGLSHADAEAAIPDLLEFVATPRSGAECEAWLTERHGAPMKGLWWALRQFGPVQHAPTGPPWSFGTRPAYVAAADPPAIADAETSAAAQVELFRRYVAAFGPVSMPDFAQFALLNRAPARAAVDAVAGELTRFDGPDGTVLYDLPGAPRPGEDVPAPPRLLAMWDSVLLVHADRGRVIPPEYRKLVTRTNGDTLPTLLVDGFVAGVWRPVDGGIEATAFRPLSDADWDGLATEAASLSALLAGREPTVYRRYDRWWAGLPAVEVRVLPS
ncbi:winged helix DNA-binding domain-containing protein [Jiangella alkaliphila]|uniref:Winged helix DNA-binding domain-containing protein n=1 Tax=Jiangella alkaliphila TaxID=419479 RepID=A0A1H2HPM8_9ACTN|nr:winged helix DNA-binding domain-containing protein [Jiangella alkaliphila]SDU33498.1 Winged helix DNA-binding domain-containing protein [Jiangella alkaliphila]